jgi:hypothetical protein
MAAVVRFNEFLSTNLPFELLTAHGFSFDKQQKKIYLGAEKNLSTLFQAAAANAGRRRRGNS